MQRKWLRLKELLSARLEGTQPRLDPIARKPRGARFTVAAVIGIAACCQPAVAAVCRVPAAVLCEGCAEKLSIRIAPGGACRISFTPATPPDQVGSAKFVDINIEPEPPRPTMHRVSTPHLSIARHAGPSRAPACFVFNSRRFCE
jgi:hypothetical protein